MRLKQCPENRFVEGGCEIPSLGGYQGGSRLSFGFRCDKEMKPNPFGFNLNFDEFLARASEGRCIRRLSYPACRRF